MALRGDFEGITRLIKENAKAMQRGGAEFLVICSNTAHVAANALEADKEGLPLLHIADCTANLIKVRNYPSFLICTPPPTL